MNSEQNNQHKRDKFGFEDKVLTRRFMINEGEKEESTLEERKVKSKLMSLHSGFKLITLDYKLTPIELSILNLGQFILKIKALLLENKEEYDLDEFFDYKVTVQYIEHLQKNLNYPEYTLSQIKQDTLHLIVYTQFNNDEESTHLTSEYQMRKCEPISHEILNNFYEGDEKCLSKVNQ